jgi:hypothetical protein
MNTCDEITPVAGSLYEMAGSMFVYLVLPGDIRCYNNVDDAKIAPGKYSACARIIFSGNITWVIVMSDDDNGG